MGPTRAIRGAGGAARRPATVWQALMRPPWRFLASRWPWAALAYLLASAVIAAALLVLVVATLLLLLPLWAIALGAVERRRTRLLGFARQPSSHVRVGADQRHNWLGVRVTEPATWREVLAVPLDLLFGAVAVVALFFQVVALVIAVAVTVNALAPGAQPQTLARNWVVEQPSDLWPLLLLVPLALGLFAYVNALLAAAQATLLRVVCGPGERELARHVERLRQSRAALVEAFEVERRRIERDLHDGVQQELVTLAARVGLVGLELEELEQRGADVASAREALDAAQGQAERAMGALRDTVRGIHPAVLTDRGLRPALEELSERTLVPVRLALAEFDRLPAPAETAAYYLVTEAVSNAAKHTTASLVRVRAAVAEGRLVVTVVDNGHGGVDEGAGSGLRGLRERAETLGGEFEVSSPVGGPTSLRMALPVAQPAAPRIAAPEDRGAGRATAAR